MQTREQILDIAEQLFNAQGYTAVGVDLITAQARVSKTSLYRLFGSKHQLISAVLCRRHQRFVDAMMQAVQAAQTPSAKVAALLRWHFDWFAQSEFYGCMFMHAVAEFKLSDNELTVQARAHKVWLKLWLSDLVKQAVPPCTAQSVIEGKASMLLTLVEGMIISAEFRMLAAEAHYLAMAEWILGPVAASKAQT